MIEDLIQISKEYPNYFKRLTLEGDWESERDDYRKASLFCQTFEGKDYNVTISPQGWTIDNETYYPTFEALAHRISTSFSVKWNEELMKKLESIESD